MKVIIVFSGNPKEGFPPFVIEQAENLQKLGIEIHLFPIFGKGIRGYIKNIIKLYRYIKKDKFDILHGHFLWSVVVCVLQVKIKKVGTFHGTDLNKWFMRKISKMVLPFLDGIIVVSNKMSQLVSSNKKIVVPCGVDLALFKPLGIDEILSNVIVDTNKKNILFCSSFDRGEKNYTMAKEAVKIAAKGIKINLIELKNLSRDQVNKLLNQVDLLLMTSLREGSPQIIKEAMACNCPIVSTDVGDVRWLLGNIEGHFITENDPQDCAEKITIALQYGKRTKGRDRVIELGLDSDTIAKRIISVYKFVLGIKKRIE